MTNQVDMLALVKEEQTVAEGLFALADMYKGCAPDGFFWKATTTFAYRLFRLGGVEEGMAVLAQVPADYFTGVAVEQMEEDPLYAELARQVADKVLEGGKVTPPSFDYDSRKVIVNSVFGKC